MRGDSLTLNDFPRIVQPGQGQGSAADLAAWLDEAADDLPGMLDETGALLFRGFGVAGAAQFEQVCMALTPELAKYTGGGSPRTHVAGRVYTTTEYPADQPIPLHCEYTYFKQVPRHIWFHCEQPPETGGQTQIGDMARVLEQLDPALVERFERLGVRYIYNLHGGNGFGRGRKEAFGTDDTAVVEAWLKEHDADFHWRADGTLHVDLVGPGLRVHQPSGRTVWGNQAVSWHISALAGGMGEKMRRVYQSDELMPKHATFGDGTPIPDEDVRQILEVLQQSEKVFDWQAGDVMLCDNHRVAHGRRPFTGPRRVLVALA